MWKDCHINYDSICFIKCKGKKDTVKFLICSEMC